jgi:Tol biopolymer transport system component
VNIDDRSIKEVTTFGGSPASDRDGTTTVFLGAGRERGGVWKVTNGGQPVRISTTAAAWPIVMADGERVMFAARLTGVQSLWTMTLSGTDQREIAKRLVVAPAVSPDGTRVVFATRTDANEQAVVICSLPSCSDEKTVPIPQNASRPWTPQWTPTGATLAYVAGFPPNIWESPLAGGLPRQLTHFADNRDIGNFAWSPDGRRLAISRIETLHDIVMIKGLKR